MQPKPEICFIDNNMHRASITSIFTISDDLSEEESLSESGNSETTTTPVLKGN